MVPLNLGLGIIIQMRLCTSLKISPGQDSFNDWSRACVIQLALRHVWIKYGIEGKGLGWITFIAFRVNDRDEATRFVSGCAGFVAILHLFSGEGTDPNHDLQEADTS